MSQSVDGAVQEQENNNNNNNNVCLYVCMLDTSCTADMRTVGPGSSLRQRFLSGASSFKHDLSVTDLPGEVL